MKHLLCTGGGSAGHVIPAIPVMDRARSDGVRVSFVGTRSGLEARLLAGHDVEFHAIASGKLRRYLSLDNVADVFRVLAGIWQAWRLLGRLRPDVVFSKGGFVTFPVVLAAWLRRIPVVAHESDLTPGLANRLSLPFVHTLCVTFPETRAPGFRGRLVVAGTPVRAALLQGDARRGRAALGVDAARPLLLVAGGSLGADAINRVVDAALEALLETFDVVHVRGPGKGSPRQAAGYHPFDYVGEGWGDLLAAADVVVSRAGANALYELLTLGKPNLLVPLSPRVSRGDQVENARLAQDRGFSRVLAEDTLTADRLLAEVQTLYRERDLARARLAQFRGPDSVAVILAALQTAAGAPPGRL